MPNLSVAMYKSPEGDYSHWALHLEDCSEHTIYEAVNGYPHFKANIITGKKPNQSLRYQRSIFMYEINAPDVPGLKEAVSSVKLQNDIVHWNCQDYVIETLDLLEEECIVDGEDKSYIKAKKELKKYFGPS
ncbi:hypothetical protein BDR22DRAFT_819811 [Usnea florida]